MQVSLKKLDKIFEFPTVESGLLPLFFLKDSNSLWIFISLTIPETAQSRQDSPLNFFG